MHGTGDRASLAPESIWAATSHEPVVYFLANGNRVKIGVSTNITARVAALSLRKANAWMVLQGGYELEGALHQYFATDRIGRTEWFLLSDRIQNYVRARQASGAVLQQPHIDTGAEPVIIPKSHKKSGSSTEGRILQALKKVTNPLGVEAIYRSKVDIGTLTGAEGSTFSNALSRLAQTGKIHRQMKDGREVPGMYGLGPAPEAE